MQHEVARCTIFQGAILASAPKRGAVATSTGTGLLQKPTADQQTNKFPAIYHFWSIIAMLTTARHTGAYLRQLNATNTLNPYSLKFHFNITLRSLHTYSMRCFRLKFCPHFSHYSMHVRAIPTSPSFIRSLKNTNSALVIHAYRTSLTLFNPVVTRITSC
jgi:hypothetical protein